MLTIVTLPRGVARWERSARPIDEVYEAVADPAQLSHCVTADAAGAKSAFGNCEGWTGMLAALKAWVEHGFNLRDGFYA